MCLFARDAQALDQNGGRADRRRFKVQVAADARDILEQLVEITGDREFLHGADNLAALDFKSAGEQGEVAADGIRARVQTGNLGQIQTVAQIAEQLVQRKLARLDEQVARLNPTRTGGVSGRLAARFFAVLRLCSSVFSTPPSMMFLV